MRICFTYTLLLGLSLLTPGLLLAQPTGSISGRVVTSDGAPASGVTITLNESRSGTTTAQDGTYRLRDLAGGSYTMLVTFVGLQSQQKTVVVQPGQTTRIDVTLAESAAQLTEVVVTGSNRTVTLNKADIAPLDLPQMTGVVSNAVITSQQAARLGDVLKNVSGVSLTQQRGGVAETFSARGYSIGIAGAGGSIFKNGVVTNTMGFPEASTLESVEVLKGSAALLYGNVSGGLIINMVTKKPKFERGGSVSMRAGSYGLLKPIVDLYGPLTKNLAVRVVGTYEKANSYRDVVQTSRVYVNPSLLYKPGRKTTVLLQGDYLKANLTPDNGIGSLNQNQDAIIPDVPRSRFINTRWAYNNVDQTSGSITLDHALSNRWKVNVIASAQHTTVTAYGAGVPNNNVAPNGDWTRALSRTLTGEKDFTGQVNLNGRFSTGAIGHQLLVGSDLVGIISTSNAFTINYGTGQMAYDKINILNPDRYEARTDIPDATRLNTTTAPSVRNGVYVQDLISLSRQIKVLAGIRWSQQQTVQTTILNTLTQVETRGITETATVSAFSPKVALLYQPTQHTSFFGSYANNFTINTGVDIYGQILQPSLVDQFEAGVKNELFNGRVMANVGVYHIVNSNFAQMAPLKADGTPNTDASVKEFTGQTTSDGLEVDFSGSVSKNLSVITGYGYNFMRYTRASLVKGSPIEGERLTNNPAHTANATLFYTVTESRLRGLKLGASAFYTGARYGGNNNTYGQTPAFSRLIPLSGFTTFDVTAGYTYQKATLLAKLSNVTNTLNYLIHDRYSIMPIPPRQFVVTLTYQL